MLTVLEKWRNRESTEPMDSNHKPYPSPWPSNNCFSKIRFEWKIKQFKWSKQEWIMLWYLSKQISICNWYVSNLTAILLNDAKKTFLDFFGEHTLMLIWSSVTNRTSFRSKKSPKWNSPKTQMDLKGGLDYVYTWRVVSVTISV